MGSLREDYLHDDFIDDVVWLREKLKSDTPVKQIWSRPIRGDTLAFLLPEYVKALNDNGVVNFSNAWEFYIESEIEGIKEESLKIVTKTLDRFSRVKHGGADPNDGSQQLLSKSRK